MAAWVLAFVLLIDLSPTFSSASAFGRVAGGDLLFGDVQVEVAGEVQTVVVHFVDPGDDQQTVALVLRGGRFYGGQAEVERANLLVIFEVIRPDGSFEQSPPTDLVGLGVDPRLFQPTTFPTLAPADDEGGLPNWSWLALAAVAAGLSAVAFWSMRDYPRRDKPRT